MCLCARLCASVLTAHSQKASPHPPFPFIASDIWKEGWDVCVCWRGDSLCEGVAHFYKHGGMVGWESCKCVTRCLPLPPPSASLPPSSAVGGCKARGERSRGESRLPSLSLTTPWEPQDSCCPPAHPHTLALRARHAESERGWERGAQHEEREGERGKDIAKEIKKTKNPGERKQKDFLFFSRGAAANNPRWRMAEGGEGEEEIQFLRTVSPAYSPFSGRLTCTGCRRGAWGWRRRWGVTRSEMSEKGNQMQLIYTLCDSTLDLKLTRDLPASTLFLHWFHSFSTFNTFAFLAVDI